MNALALALAAGITLLAFLSMRQGKAEMAERLVGKLSKSQVHNLAAELIRRYGFNVPVCRACAIAWIESRFDADAIGDDGKSIGLMQTLLTTAQWLARDMGYTAFGIPSRADLLRAETSMYFGLAYLDYLSRWKNQNRTEAWVVQSYNGGPGGHGSATFKYLERFLAAKQEVC